MSNPDVSQLEALKALVREFPTDSDLEQAGWEPDAVKRACDAYDNARAVIAQAESAPHLHPDTNALIEKAEAMEGELAALASLARRAIAVAASVGRLQERPLSGTAELVAAEGPRFLQEWVSHHVPTGDETLDRRIECAAWDWWLKRAALAQAEAAHPVAWVSANIAFAAQAVLKQLDEPFPREELSLDVVRMLARWLAAPQPAEAAQPVEMSPEFTDTARAALLWVLWHHQGGSCPVGQPLRYALGIGAHDSLSAHQVAEAKRWAALTKSTTAHFHGRVTPQVPAEAAQPVAWRWRIRHPTDAPGFVSLWKLSAMRPPMTPATEVQPLYAAPQPAEAAPKQEAVLTDEHILKLAGEAGIVTGENLRRDGYMLHRSVGESTNVRSTHLIALVRTALAAQPQQPVPVPVALTGEERAELQRLRALLNTPQLHDFSQAVVLEAAHQRERWGSAHDAGKAPEDWFWLIGYLVGKALAAVKAGDAAKALHHTISSAAALANWHAALTGEHTSMRPGIDPVSRGIEAAAPMTAQGETR